MPYFLPLLLLLFMGCSKPSLTPSKPNVIQEHIYEVGETILPFSLPTQHQKMATFDASHGTILITYDKVSTALQNSFIASKETHYLLQNDIVCIVDVSMIPEGIRTLFVLPKLESFRHVLLLSYDANFSRMWPYKDGHISVVNVKNFKVETIEYANTLKALEALLP